jgi:hypothetical protein
VSTIEAADAHRNAGGPHKTSGTEKWFAARCTTRRQSGRTSKRRIGFPATFRVAAALNDGARRRARMPAEKTAQSRHYLGATLPWFVVVGDDEKGTTCTLSRTACMIMSSHPMHAGLPITLNPRSIAATASVGPSTINRGTPGDPCAERNTPCLLRVTAHFRLGPQLSVMQVRYALACD